MTPREAKKQVESPRRRKLAIVGVVLALAIVGAFPLSLLVNKLNHTNDTADHLAAQQDQISRQQDQIGSVLVQLRGVATQNRRLTCTFGSLALAQPIAQLVREDDVDFAARLRTYRHILRAVRSGGNCQVALGPVFRRRVQEKISQINQAINALPPAARQGAGSGGGAGGHPGGQKPGHNPTPGTNAQPSPGTPGGTNPGNGNGGGNGPAPGNGNGPGDSIGQGVKDIVDGVQGAADNAIDGLQEGLDDILHSKKP